MRSGHVAVIICAIVVMTLVSGCTGPGSMSDNTSVSGNISDVSGLPLPPGSSTAEDARWFEYDITEEFLSSGRPYIENLRVRVESGNETADGVQVLHKRIGLTQMYGDTHSYDAYVDEASGKILSGNFTSVNMGVPHTSLLPSGADYASALGYLDVPARLSSGNAGALVFAGCETAEFDGEPYQCTLYNTTFGDVAYTLWLNTSLPWPVKIIANPAGPDETVRRTYVLAGWKDTTSAGTGVPEAIVKPGPSRLFKIDDLAWYSYLSGGEYDSTATKIEHSSVTYEGVPARYTRITKETLDGDYGEDKELYERKSDGRILYGNTTFYNFGRDIGSSVIGPGAYPGNYYADVALYDDVAAPFNADRDKALEAAGSETIEYAGRQYVCDKYYMPTGNANYTVWHNESIPLPLKVAVRYNGSSGTETYKLTGWGKENVRGIPTPTPGPTAISSPAPTPGPSGLFEMEGIAWYKYVVAVPMDDMVRHYKMNVSYGVSNHGYMARNGTMVEAQEKYTSIDYAWSSDGFVSGYSIFENESGAVVGGAVSGRDLNKGTAGALGLDAEQARAAKGRDLSTWFDSETDRTMEFAGSENVRYNGDLYNCAMYDIATENATYRVWHNATLPLPLKIVVDTHRYPIVYYELPGAHNVTGPSTYELMDYGVVEENSPAGIY